MKTTELYGRPWSEPEYLLALDLYFNHKQQSQHKNSTLVRELSAIMGRTPGAIAMRLENFASIDPEQTRLRSGLTNISSMCKQVFEAWVDKPENLRSVAEVFRRDLENKKYSRTLFDPDPITVPKALEKYELLDQIGEGSYGKVFSCIDAQTGSTYAIKIINTAQARDPEVVHRFCREIRALKFVSHPNVITLHEDNLGIENRYPAFVMDLAASNLTAFANETFRSGSQQRPVIDTETSTRILRSISSACIALHANSPRVIHRDINPNNILLLPEGDWALADFGMAKFLSTAPLTTSFATRTQPGWGTDYYGSPEQYKDFKRTDERTDIFALGTLLWELFTTSWPPPDRQDSGLPHDLTVLYRRATEREPEARFKSVREFLDALEATETFASFPPTSSSSRNE